MEGTKELKEKLYKDKKSGWEKLSDDELANIFKFADEYMYYLNLSKTEKEIVRNSKDILIKNGFVDISEKETLRPGDKIFYINRGRNVFAAVIGEENLEEGMRMVVAHADSPRIDLKQNPLYEDNGIAMLKTHYYGGIKKYQWVNVPLSMHGIVVKPDGERVEISIGEKDEEPVFTISDLPPHLAMDQMKKTPAEVVEGEQLNVLMGSIPYPDDEMSERVKLNILDLLNKKYGIKEIDFTSSEIEMVPAYKARSIGLDYSMIAGYGHDDKVCCYTSLRAILEVSNPKNTAVCILTDREEIGFDGVSGMYSQMFETFVLEMLEKTGNTKASSLHKTFSNTKAISADTDVAYDPSYAYAFEKNNVAVFGNGISISKYTGSRGKYNSSEAPAEFIAEIRRLWDNAGVKYQSCEIGRVDKGGGGTIALTLANRGMDVLDAGVPVMGVHSPYEIASKVDVYNAYRGYKAFYKG